MSISKSALYFKSRNNQCSDKFIRSNYFINWG